jgi:hypothetical protein
MRPFNLVSSFQSVCLGDFLMGKYLCFRDALALAQTCRTTHNWMFNSRNYIQYYIRELLKRHALTKIDHQDSGDGNNNGPPELATEWSKLRRLPIFQHMEEMDYIRASVVSSAYVNNYLKEPQHIISQGVFIPIEKNSDEYHFGLTCCVDHLDAASQYLNSHQDGLANISSNRRELRLKRWSFWFSHVLVEWAHGLSGPMSSWSQGKHRWKNAVLRFLLHSVDIGSSIWDAYLQDPRYLGFYRPQIFSPTGGFHLDFWHLSNYLFQVNAHHPLISPDAPPPILNSNNVPVSKFVAKGTCRGARGFQFFYRLHREGALRAPSLERPDPLASSFTNSDFGIDVIDTINGREISDGRTTGWLEVRHLTPKYYSLLIHYGQIPQAHLMAVIEPPNIIHPVEEEWERWERGILPFKTPKKGH